MNKQVAIGLIGLILLLLTQHFCFGQHWFSGQSIPANNSKEILDFELADDYLVLLGLPGTGYKGMVKHEGIKSIKILENNTLFRLFEFDIKGRLSKRVISGKPIEVDFFEYDTTGLLSSIESFYSSFEKQEMVCYQSKIFHNCDSLGKIVRSDWIKRESTIPFIGNSTHSRCIAGATGGCEKGKIIKHWTYIYSYHKNGQLYSRERLAPRRKPTTKHLQVVFDPNGNIVQKGDATFSYNHQGEIVEEKVLRPMSNKRSLLKFRYYYLKDENGLLEKRIKMIQGKKICDEIINYDDRGRIIEVCNFNHDLNREAWGCTTFEYSDSLIVKKMSRRRFHEELSVLSGVRLWEISEVMYYSNSGKVIEEECKYSRTPSGFGIKTSSKFYWKPSGLLEKAELQTPKYLSGSDHLTSEEKKLEVQYAFY